MIQARRDVVSEDGILSTKRDCWYDLSKPTRDVG